MRLKILKDYLPKHVQARKDNDGLPEEPMPEVVHGKLCTVAETLPSSKTLAVAGAVCSCNRSSAEHAVRSRLANLRVGLFDRGEFSELRFSLCFPFSICQRRPFQFRRNLPSVAEGVSASEASTVVVLLSSTCSCSYSVCSQARGTREAKGFLPPP